jgi:hypothetical protein
MVLRFVMIFSLNLARKYFPVPLYGCRGGVLGTAVMEYTLNDPAQVLRQLPALVAPVLHVFLVLWGLLDCFFGFRIFRATLKILMAFAFAVLGPSVAARVFPGSVPAFLVAGVIGLVLGFVVGWYLYKVGVVAMALFAGFVLSAPFVAGMGANAFLAQCGVALAAGVVAFFLLEPIVIASTALTGAYRVVFGVLFFMGGQNLMNYINGGASYEDLFLGMGRIPMYATLLLAALGGFLQFSSWRREGRSSKEEAEED